MGPQGLTKKQRIETLEKEVSELKLIVHELRARKVVEPSTIDDVLQKEIVEVIEFEGAKYRKVERKAREGDVVSVPFKDGNCFKPNKIYGPVFKGESSLKVKADSSTGKRDYEESLVYNDFYGRTLDTVDVYEPITEPSTTTTVEDEPKSPNQLRAEVIEKAKGFVESRRLKNHTFKQAPGQIRAGEILTYDDVYEVPSRIHKLSEYVGVCKVKFIVNTEKRTIVALFYGATSNRLFTKGIAKCNPSDVFNEHIGKAIALGRALGLDVSEFEQAVQPTNYAIGQIGINETLGGKYPFEIIEIGKGDVFRKQFEPFTTSYGDTIHPLGFEDETTKALLIINDTNAIYGGVE